MEFLKSIARAKLEEKLAEKAIDICDIDVEEFETKMTLVEYENLQKRIKIFDDWSEDDEPKDNWTIKPQEDIPRADWDIDDDESEGEDSFRPYECRRPEPGDVQYEVGQSLRMDPDRVEHLSEKQFCARFGKVQGDREEERLAAMTPHERRHEVEEMSRDLGQLKGQLQSSLAKSKQEKGLQKAFQSTLDRIRVLLERSAFLISPDE